MRINPGAIIKASQFELSAEESILQDVQLNLGWAGDHLVKGKGSLQLAGSTMIQINASGVSGGWQKAGTLKFHSKKLIVDSDVSILSSTKGGEQSASLVLDAENFTLDGGLIQTVTSGMGRAGDVSLRANSSSIQNGGSLGSKTEGEGASGDIHVEGGRLVLDGESSLRSGVDLNAEEMSLDAIGDAGAVTINVESISLSGGSYVASTGLDMGQSKDVNVKASSIILGEQSYITSTSQVTEEVGAYGFFEAREERELTRNGGISLTGKAIELSSGSYLKTTTNLPYRQAGDIVIKGESIVLAGGFDSFELKRHQYFAKEENGQTYLERMIKFGNRVQDSLKSNQVDMFGDIQESTIQVPVPAESEEWTAMGLLSKEKEVVGIYLSGHPLDDYKLEITNFSNGNLSMLDNMQKIKGKKINLSGVVTGVEHKETKTGKPFGILHFEDYNSSYSFYLFGQDYLTFKSYLTAGWLLYISGKVQKKFYNDDLEFKISSIDLLAR